MNDIEEAISYIENTKKHLLHLGEIWYADYLDDAIDLLKEQEPVRPIIKQEMDDICSCIENIAYCGRCGARIGRLKQNYCSECGQAVKWE